MIFASEVVSGVVAAPPQSFASGVLSGVVDAMPIAYSSEPVAMELEVSIPSYVFSGPTEDYLSPLLAPRSFSGHTAGTSLLDPSERHGGPTTGTALFAAESSFGGPTQDDVAATSPVNNYSGTAGGPARYAPLRGFGGSTEGINEGIRSPYGLVATPLDAGCIGLTWTDPGPDEFGTDEDGYRIERSLAGADTWETIGTVSQGTSTFTDRLAVPLVSYDYRVFGFDAVKDSFPTNVATAMTGLPPSLPVFPPPAAPSDPVRNELAPRQIQVKSPGTYGVEESNGSA